MKLVINYDLMDAICNVNEPLTLLKVVRNKKVDYLTFNVPFFSIIDFLIESQSLEFFGTLGLQMGVVVATHMGIDLLCSRIVGADQYGYKSAKDLKKLVGQLDALNISTSYDLLLKSEVYDKKHKVEINKDHLPYIAESKYILVPSYTYNGDIKDTSVLQEHIIGSKEYVLSLGSPKKVLKPSYSSI